MVKLTAFLLVGALLFNLEEVSSWLISVLAPYSEALLLVVASVVWLVFLYYYVVPFILRWFAKENVLFATVKEGTVKAVMRGETFDHFIMAFKEYHLNDPRQKGKDKDRYKSEYKQGDDTIKLYDWDVLYHGKDNPYGFTNTDDTHYDDREETWFGRYLKSIGLYWVGWPWAMSIYVYQFEWNETYTVKETGEERILPRAESTDFVYVSDFIYAVKTTDAETRDLLTTSELTLLTIAIRNPYRALFSGENWLQRVVAAVNRRVRNFVGDHNYQELISIPQHKPEDGQSVDRDVNEHWERFSKPIIKLTGELPDDVKDQHPRGLKERYGAEIRTADLQTVDLSGKKVEELQDAARKVYVAQQSAEATRLEGKAHAEVIVMKGEAEAKSLGKRLRVAKKYDHLGEKLLHLDGLVAASEGGSNNIIWGDNPFGKMLSLLNASGERNNKGLGNQQQPLTEKGGEQS